VRNYFSRREQWRVFLLVASLGVVVFAMRALRQPENVERVAHAFANEPQVEAAKERATAEDLGTKPSEREHSADAILPKIERDVLEAIEDNTYFRNTEQAAWFRFLEVVRGASREQVAAVQGRGVDYVQLVDQPDFYRGKFVTVHGWVRQVTEHTPASNELGIESYHRVVVQPSNGNWPIFVYCLELPQELQKADVGGSVQVTGLFFKNLSYPWEGGVGIAPVIVAKRVGYVGGDVGEVPVERRVAISSDDWIDAKPQAAGAAFREVLALAGWDNARLATFDDGEAFSDEQRLEAIQLLRRLRSFDSPSLEDWVHDDLTPNAVLNDADAHRGELARLTGRVIQVVRRTLDAADAVRLEMPEYFECDIKLDKLSGQATVLTARVPQAWLSAESLDEPTTAVALYLKRHADKDASAAVWLAKELAWHPTVVDEPRVSLGESILGSLGMDVGLLDVVRSRGSIHTIEREAFYQMLDAAGRIGAHQLSRSAQRNLDQMRQRWVGEAKKTTDKPGRALAHEVVRRADQGRYSVAPLFNDPEQNTGQIFTFDGVARQVLRIEVGTRPDAGPSDVARRFGIDHYYEIQIFTDDSQNYPLVFCMRELPAGFPIGGNLHVPVRMAGFFFKDWLYTTRGTASADPGDTDAHASRSQFAPLLIGRSPLSLQIENEGGNVARLVGGSLFLLGLVGFGAVAWWFSRDERRFSQRRRNAGFLWDPGQSLKGLNVDAEIEPITDTGILERHTNEAR
jgi:hypothetical protein